MQELIDRLYELAEWAEANEWETPIDLADRLREAAAYLAAAVDFAERAGKAMAKGGAEALERLEGNDD